MTNIDIIKTLSKPWANVKDIMVLGYCGRDKASKIRDSIKNDIYKQGKLLPTSKYSLVPMEYVINYFNLNVDYIYDMAQKEKALI